MTCCKRQSSSSSLLAPPGIERQHLVVDDNGQGFDVGTPLGELQRSPPENIEAVEKMEDVVKTNNNASSADKDKLFGETYV